MREKKIKVKLMKMENKDKIGELKDHQGVLEEITEVKLVEILEEREDSVELEAVGVLISVVEEDREVLIVEDPMIEMMMASITTTINIHSQPTKKKVMMRFNKPMSKSSG